jgi:hypothetical protein
MVTFTLPEELRSLARSHQKTVYNILFRASADALLQLASDPRFVGAKIGMVGVLHTWTRDLFYHPHTHYIAIGGGLSDDGRWLDSRPDFLVHVKPLSILVRAKFRDQLKKTDLFPLVDQHIWNKDWVVHCQPVGTGEAAFKYLAPYIFRVAISNKRILKLEDRCLLEKARELLGASTIDNSTSTQSQQDNELSAARRCPSCGSILKLIQRLKPQTRWPP